MAGMLKEEATVVAAAHRRVEAGCAYCSSFLVGRRSRPWDTVLFESDNFVVVPTRGAIVEGWLLVVSKEHVLCMGALARGIHRELCEIVEHTSSVFEQAYGRPTVFEHGPSKTGLGIGCGVDHAHLHLVPLDFSLRSATARSLERFRANWVPSAEGLGSLKGLHELGRSYLYLAEPGASAVHCASDTLPCQFMRRVIAKECGLLEEYDYHTHPRQVSVVKTVDRLRGRF